MKSYFLLFSTVFLISFSYLLPQIYAQEELDFENCEGFLSVDELKNEINFEEEITVRSRPLMPVDDVSGLQTMCNSTFESSKGAISMSVIVFDSAEPAIAIYDKNLNEMKSADQTINEYLTFWKNAQIDLNMQGLGSIVFSQYQKFFLNFHTTLTENNETLVSVEELQKLSSMVQKKILDLPEVTISPPNPTIDDDGPTTDEPPPKPGPGPIEIGKVLSPKKQVAQGIAPEEVMCNEGLILFIKYNGSPACVRPETSLTLEQRNWGELPSDFSIDSFEECIAAGNPAMESYPRQCRTSDGKHFVENISGQEQCLLSGGLWGIWSNAVDSSPECNPPTSDQGKECTDSTQCQSFCQAKEGSEINSEDTGMCYGYELAICMQEVRNGLVEPEWCQ